MNGFDRQIYRECKGFYKPTGVTNPTDAEVIIEMSKRQEHSDKAKADAFAKEKEALCAEIEKYKEAAKQTETEIADLKTENYKLKLDNTLLRIQTYDLGEPKKPTVHTVHFGDVIVYKQNADDPYEVAFKITDCIVHMDTESVGTVDLSGVRIRTK